MVENTIMIVLSTQSLLIFLLLSRIISFETYTVFLWLYDRVFSFQNNPKELDSSYKTDLDLWNGLGMVELVL